MKMTPRQAREWGLLDPAKASRRKPRPRDRKPARDALFDALCKEHGLPVPVQEYQFAPPRKWRFDFLFEGWLALEVEGGAFTRGRHTRGKGFLADIEKYNTAAVMGFTVIRCTPQDVKSGAAFALVKRALEARGEQP